MSERDSATRNPDESVLGDANIPDFLAQQQGAADLADFALTAPNAGVVAGDAAIFGGGTALATTLPLDLSDVSGYTGVAGGAVSISTAVVNDAPASVLLTPSGAANAVTATTPLISLPGSAYIRVIGALQYHEISFANHHITVEIAWYDENNVAVNDTLAWPTKLLGPYKSLNDAWLAVDEFAAVPAGATQYAFIFTMYQDDGGNLNAAELVYFNNLQAQAATLYTGVHAGSITGRDDTVGRGKAAHFSHASGTQAVTSATGVDLAMGGPVVTYQTTWAPKRGRLYKVSVSGLLGIQSVAQGTAKVFLVDAANNVLALLFDQILPAAAPGNRGVLDGFGFLSGLPTNVPYTVKLRALVSAGTITWQHDTGAPCFILVEDVGPDVADLT